MKTTLLIAFLTYGAALSGVAQTLAMPADSVSVDSPRQEVPESKYNTPSESYKDERNEIRRGNAFYEKEQYHQALEAYDKALQINAGSIRARYNKAMALFQLQSDDNKGTQNDPRVMACELLTGLIEDARRYDPEVAEKSYYNLGNTAYNDEDYGRSIELYKDALRLNPDDMAARENLRLAQLKKQEQENQDQNENQDKQDEQQDKQDQQQQEQQDQQQDQQQQQQQQQPQPMTQSAQQILQTMQNKENATRKKVKEDERPATGRPQTDKPW